jgi:hypothetical protein
LLDTSAVPAEQAERFTVPPLAAELTRVYEYEFTDDTAIATFWMHYRILALSTPFAQSERRKRKKSGSLESDVKTGSVTRVVNVPNSGQYYNVGDKPEFIGGKTTQDICSCIHHVRTTDEAREMPDDGYALLPANGIGGFHSTLMNGS